MSEISQFYTTIFYPYLIFKLKLKKNDNRTAVNQSKIKKDGGKTIGFYRKSRTIYYASTINKFIKSFQTDNLIKSNDSGIDVVWSN